MVRDNRGRFTGIGKIKSICKICKSEIWDYRKRNVCSKPKNCINKIRSINFSNEKNPSKKAYVREIQRITKLRENNPRWKGGRIYFNGWIMIKKRDHPYQNNQGYIFEHRLIIEKHINRYLKADEYIHHINGIKDDNRIENLLIVSRKQHFFLHMTHKNKPDLYLKEVKKFKKAFAESLIK